MHQVVRSAILGGSKLIKLNSSKTKHLEALGESRLRGVVRPEKVGPGEAAAAAARHWAQQLKILAMRRSLTVLSSTTLPLEGLREFQEMAVFQAAMEVRALKAATLRAARYLETPGRW